MASIQILEKKIEAARREVHDAQTARMKLDEGHHDAMGQRSRLSLEERKDAYGQWREASDIEMAARGRFESLVEEMKVARVREQGDLRRKARADRKRARDRGEVPDVPGARTAFATAEEAQRTEIERSQAARDTLKGIEDQLSRAIPSGAAFEKLIAARTTAQATVSAFDVRAAAFQAAVEAARIKLAEVENFGAVEAFDSAADEVANAGDAFTDAVVAARAPLNEALGRFNDALAKAAGLYVHLPELVRQGRSPHGVHRLGEIFGAGGTNDVFFAATHAFKRAGE
jgi:hypothetical protein